MNKIHILGAAAATALLSGLGLTAAMAADGPSGADDGHTATVESRHGADDPAGDDVGDDNGGRHGDDHGGHGSDDGPHHD